MWSSAVQCIAVWRSVVQHTTHTYTHILRARTRTRTQTQTRKHADTQALLVHKFSGCLILIGHFPQQSPIISGIWAERELQLTGSNVSLPPCRMQGCFYKFSCQRLLHWSECNSCQQLLHSLVRDPITFSKSGKYGDYVYFITVALAFQKLNHRAAHKSCPKQ